MDTNEFKPMSVADLKKRGHCCKSSCVHCPYGFTLKKFGLKFSTYEEFTATRSIVEDHYKEGSHIALLKDYPVASFKVNHIIITDFILFEDFEGQGISKEVVESYFFY